MTISKVSDANKFTHELSIEIFRDGQTIEQVSGNSGISIEKIQGYLNGEYAPSAPTLGILLRHSTPHRAKMVLDACAEMDSLGDKPDSD